MIEYLLIKVDITDPFDNNIKFCEYYQVLREEFFSVESNSIEYKYYTLSGSFKKRLSRHIANTFISFLYIPNHISKDDAEYLNKYFCYGSATIVYKYTI